MQERQPPGLHDRPERRLRRPSAARAARSRVRGSFGNRKRPISVFRAVFPPFPFPGAGCHDRSAAREAAARVRRKAEAGATRRRRRSGAAAQGRARGGRGAVPSLPRGARCGRARRWRRRNARRRAARCGRRPRRARRARRGRRRPEARRCEATAPGRASGPPRAARGRSGSGTRATWRRSDASQSRAVSTNRSDGRRWPRWPSARRSASPAAAVVSARSSRQATAARASAAASRSAGEQERVVRRRRRRKRSYLERAVEPAREAPARQLGDERQEREDAQLGTSATQPRHGPIILLFQRPGKAWPAYVVFTNCLPRKSGSWCACGHLAAHLTCDSGVASATEA